MSLNRNPSSNAGPWVRLRSAARGAYRRLLQLHGCPHTIALGMALGLLVGMTPTMGIQMPIAVALAIPLGANKLSAAMGVWITNPLSAPIVYGFTYLVGTRCLGSSAGIALDGGFDLPMLRALLQQAPDILWAMTVGGVVAGIPIALLGYWLSHRAVLAYRSARRSGSHF